MALTSAVVNSRFACRSLGRFIAATLFVTKDNVYQIRYNIDRFEAFCNLTTVAAGPMLQAKDTVARAFGTSRAAF
jgi:hypothetical protein